MNRYFYLKNPWWEGKRFNAGVERKKYLEQLERNINQDLIQVLTGLRRVGKSTIALQLVKSLIKNGGINPKRILFFSIEEPSISKTPISEIINDFRAEHNIRSNTKVYVFIDEIQFRDNWEQEIKSLYDSENIKFVLTGSSAMLLSEKLSYLTGRYQKTQVFPLSFSEYLDFKKTKVSKTNNYLLIKKAQEYLTEGGMPEYILNKPERYLETTVESILFKDLISKFELRNPKILSDIIYLLSDRIGTTSSSLKLAKILEINKTTILTYINYLNKTFLISELPNFSTSRNKQMYNPDKIYFEDLGIAKNYASKINNGALMENAVYNHIKIQILGQPKKKLGYWYEEKNEIDFVLFENNRHILIESKFVDRIEDIDFKPLEKAVKALKPKKIIYVTRKIEGKKDINGNEVIFLPLYEFLRRDLDFLFT